MNSLIVILNNLTIQYKVGKVFWDTLYQKYAWLLVEETHFCLLIGSDALVSLTKVYTCQTPDLDQILASTDSCLCVITDHSVVITGKVCIIPANSHQHNTSSPNLQYLCGISYLVIPRQQQLVLQNSHYSIIIQGVP